MPWLSRRCARGLALKPVHWHPSGHSTFSAAAAQVLRSFTGSDTLGLPVSRQYFQGIAAG
jgi:hypothetical protein